MSVYPDLVQDGEASAVLSVGIAYENVGYLDTVYLLDLLYNGKGKWYGIKGFFDWLETKKYKIHVRVKLAKYRSYEPCPECHGSRLKHVVNHVKFRDLTLGDLFAVWGRRLSPRRLLGFHGAVRVYRAGLRLRIDPRALVLRDQDQIVLEVGPFIPPHAAYRFPRH